MTDFDRFFRMGLARRNETADWIAQGFAMAAGIDQATARQAVMAAVPMGAERLLDAPPLDLFQKVAATLGVDLDSVRFAPGQIS